MDSESCRNATGEGEASTPRERTIHIPFHERPDSPAGAARNSMAAVLAMLPAVSLHD